MNARKIHQSLLMGFACALLLAATSSHASVISMSTRPIADSTLGNSADDYLNNWNAALGANPIAPSGYCDTSLASYSGASNQASCGGSATDVSFHFQVDFGVTSAEAGVWIINVGPDFGLGGAIYIDGVAFAYSSDDLWWNGSYGNTAETFSISVTLTAGNHTLDIYGQEQCCDGAQEAQYLAPNAQAFVTFSSNDGLNAIPEPVSLALFGLGLFVLAAVRRQR